MIGLKFRIEFLKMLCSKQEMLIFNTENSATHVISNIGHRRHSSIFIAEINNETFKHAVFLVEDRSFAPTVTPTIATRQLQPFVTQPL